MLPKNFKVTGKQAKMAAAMMPMKKGKKRMPMKAAKTVVTAKKSKRMFTPPGMEPDGDEY